MNRRSFLFGLATLPLAGAAAAETAVVGMDCAGPGVVWTAFGGRTGPLSKVVYDEIHEFNYCRSIAMEQLPVEEWLIQYLPGGRIAVGAHINWCGVYWTKTNRPDFFMKMITTKA